MVPTDEELVQLAARRAQLRSRYLLPAAARPATNGRGIHHAALICSDVERTIGFYQGLLGFFDFPGLGLEQGEEAIGGVQHVGARSAKRGEMSGRRAWSP